jgi:hypothetical protein
MSRPPHPPRFYKLLIMQFSPPYQLLLVIAIVDLSSITLSTLMIEAIPASETSVISRTTRPYIPIDDILRISYLWQWNKPNKKPYKAISKRCRIEVLSTSFPEEHVSFIFKVEESCTFHPFHTGFFCGLIFDGEDGDIFHPNIMWLSKVYRPLYSIKFYRCESLNYYLV